MPQTTLSFDSTLSARKDLLASSLSDIELVMMDVDKGLYYGLDNVGKAIWDHLEQPRRVAEICQMVEREFEADKATIEQDTLVFLDQLLSAGLVELNQVQSLS